MGDSGGGKGPEIFTYDAPHVVYSLAWSGDKDKKRIAVGSFIEEYANKVEVMQLDDNGRFVQAGRFDHPYPATKIMWRPRRGAGAMGNTDLVGTTGDYLRLWKVKDGGGGDDGKKDGGVELHCLLNNNKNSEYCAPLTSFDWNESAPHLIGTSSIDTTCTIWDIEKQRAKTQLIAHDKEVFDIAFAQGQNVFASVGADGSVRMFDLRNLEHSTIIYETPGLVPLLRFSWNKQDPNYLATMMMDSPKAIVLDIRVPSLPVAELEGHLACVNALQWAPHSSCHLCTVGDDCQALIWDVSEMPKAIEDPILAYTAEGEINQLQWSAAQPDWVAIAFGKKVQMLKV